MRSSISLFAACLLPAVCGAQMVPSDSIGNDPTKEKLCAERAKMGKPVPFMIDQRYVNSARSSNPDATFIAVDDGQLIQCHLLAGSGKYGPASYSPEQRFWQLVKPEQFKPGINTDRGIAMAAEACTSIVPDRINRPNFDHIVRTSVIEASKREAGRTIGGKKAERYDIIVTGKSFYKAAGPDLATIDFICLLSPMLEVRSVQWR